jgi:ABC-type branched-subunit amino acid transport system substrate-binding protein/mono/diheme cytochrome c family protein
LFRLFLVVQAFSLCLAYENPGKEIYLHDCAGCHGQDGRGKPEGGVTPSNIRWEELTRPYDVTHPSGRKHPPYTERSLVRAISMGFDPAGNTLHTIMPRVALSREDMHELIAYLKVIGTRPDPGVSENSIRVGTILPTTGMGAAVRAALDAFFDTVNRDGGVYNRTIELRNGSEDVFALVSSYLAGSEAEMTKSLRERETPLIGAFTLEPQLGFPLNPYVFYLDSGLRGQAEALAAYAVSKRAVRPTRAAVIAADGALFREAAEAVEARLRQAGWKDVRRVSYFVKLDGIDVAFCLAPAPLIKAFLMSAADGGPAFYIPGSLVTGELFDVPATLNGRLWAAFPTLPSDPTPQGMAEYHRLAERYQLRPQHLAAQLTALASAKVLLEGLERVGRDLTREKFVAAIEKLYDFQTGFTPPLSFGPNRRVGSLGAHIVSIDLAAGRFVPITRIE